MPVIITTADTINGIATLQNLMVFRLSHRLIWYRFISRLVFRLTF